MLTENKEGCKIPLPDHDGLIALGKKQALQLATCHIAHRQVLKVRHTLVRLPVSNILIPKNILKNPKISNNVFLISKYLLTFDSGPKEVCSKIPTSN